MSSEYVYFYDGSFEGMMCCIFESFEKKEIPIAMECGNFYEGRTCFKIKKIETDLKRAERIIKSISEKISLRAKELIEHTFLSDLHEKELHILYFMRLGYKYGPKVLDMTYQEDVQMLIYAEAKLLREAHAMSGLINFTREGNMLTAKINPKNNVLPLLASHLCRKMHGKNFSVFDSTHHTIFVHKDGVRNFIMNTVPQ